MDRCGPNGCLFADLLAIIFQNLLAFGIGWFLIGLLPFSNIFPINAYLAEHWLYLPSIGIFAALAAFSLDLKRLRPLWLGLLACLYAAMTISVNPVWKNDITLNRHVLRFAPDNGVAALGLANAYYRAGRTDEARSVLEGLSSAEPLIDWKIQNTLGLIHEVQGDPAQALLCFQKAVRIHPGSAVAQYNLGRTYLGLRGMGAFVSEGLWAVPQSLRGTQSDRWGGGAACCGADGAVRAAA